jgi:DNA mismatch endonuclease (patch repair protein)
LTDVVNKGKRSSMMSGIRGKNTKPEILIRKKLHAEGFRYKLHDSRLPGKPDIVFPKYHAVIFVNGCFWHRHDCHLFKWPQSNSEFWLKKINLTYITDQKNYKELSEQGWRILEIWECAIKGKEKIPVDFLIIQISFWLTSATNYLIIRGQKKEDQ